MVFSPPHNLMPWACCLSCCVCVFVWAVVLKGGGQLEGYVAPWPQHQLGDYPIERIQGRGASMGLDEGLVWTGEGGREVRGGCFKAWLRLINLLDTLTDVTASKLMVYDIHTLQWLWAGVAVMFRFMSESCDFKKPLAHCWVAGQLVIKIREDYWIVHQKDCDLIWVFVRRKVVFRLV